MLILPLQATLSPSYLGLHNKIVPQQHIILFSINPLLTFDIVLQYHPDVNKEPNAPEKFKEIKDAYEVNMEIYYF